MSASAFPSPIYKSPLHSSLASNSRTYKLLGNPKISAKNGVLLHSSLASQAITSDPFVLELAETLEDSLSSSSSPPLPLQKLRDSSSESLLSISWPSRKDESFRFTDISFIRHSEIHPASKLPVPSRLLGISVNTQLPYLVLVNGHLVQSLSNMSELPKGVYVGGLSELNSTSIMEKVSEFVYHLDGGDLFWSINGVGAPDITVIYVPEGCQVEGPIHSSYYSIEGDKEGSNAMHVSNPRVLLLVEKGGEVDVIEEFSTIDGNKCYWTNSAFEAVIREGGKVRHSYIQSQSSSAAHIKWTSVRQESSGTYELTEVSIGGKLGRHNLQIQQLGPETVTDLSTLHLSVTDQRSAE